MRIFSRGAIFTLSGVRLLASSLAICFLYLTFFASVVIGQARGPRTRWGLLGVVPEGHSEGAEQFAGLVVVVAAHDEGDVHALGERHLVGVDLGEHQLLRQP